MNKYQRWITEAPFDGHPDRRKKRMCRWCGKRVQGRRQNWCSQQCVDEFLIRKSSSEVRRQVFARDRGVCAICGFDTSMWRDFVRWFKVAMRNVDHPDWRLAIIDYLRGHGLTYKDFHRRTLWDADHIIPVSEGGGCCGLDNYRTLCVGCHRQETAKLKRRLSKRETRVSLSAE